MQKINIVVLAMSFFLVACGGDSVPGVIDGPPNPDTAPLGCTLDAAYGGLVLGSAGAPVAIDGRRDGANNFEAVAFPGLPADPGAQTTGVLMIFTDGNGVFAGGFTTGTDLTLDTDPNCGACLVGLGGFTTTSADATEIYVTTAGTITISRFDAATALGVSRIEGAYNNVSMEGFEANTGNPLVPACVSTFESLAFWFDVTWPA